MAPKQFESYEEKNKKMKLKDCHPVYFVDANKNVLIGWQVYYDGATLTVDAE